MKKSELPLYLKISPIYNKILQLAIAVICIAVLMNVFTQSQNTHNSVISKHFSDSSKEQLSQAVAALKVLNRKKDRQAIDEYVKTLSQLPTIHDVSYYDATGLLIASANNVGENSDSSADSDEHLSVNDFFNLHEQSLKHRLDFKTFVQEVRDPQLIGYLRITINEKQVAKALNQSSFDVHETMRLMALFAVVIGFFLTRGFSRFSRQGFRLSK